MSDQDARGRVSPRRDGHSSGTPSDASRNATDGVPDGPGVSERRPHVTRRAIEQDYIAALADAVSLEDWREIVRAAVERAKAGDYRARQWLAGHLTGDRSLLKLAANEYNGDTPQRDIERAAGSQRQKNELDDLIGSLFKRRVADSARGRPE